MEMPFLVYGAGGHAKVALDAARSSGIHVHLVLDDDASKLELCGWKVSRPAKTSELGHDGFAFIVAVGDNLDRARIFGNLIAEGGTPMSLIHQGSILSPSARIGAGTLVCAGVVVNPDAEVGRNCILNTSCSVDHDCVVGDHVHLCPGVRLGGKVTIGAGTMIGLGAVVLPNIKIGDHSIIGAGAVVNRDLPSGVVAYGNPTRVKRKL